MVTYSIIIGLLVLAIVYNCRIINLEGGTTPIICPKCTLTLSKV